MACLSAYSPKFHQHNESPASAGTLASANSVAGSKAGAGDARALTTVAPFGGLGPTVSVRLWLRVRGFLPEMLGLKVLEVRFGMFGMFGPARRRWETISEQRRSVRNA